MILVDTGNDTGYQLPIFLNNIGKLLVFQYYFYFLPEMAETGVSDVQMDSNTRIMWKIEDLVCFLNVSQVLKSEHVYTSRDRITYYAYYLGIC